jgi:phage-related protein (TIGR01555 family)
MGFFDRFRERELKQDGLVNESIGQGTGIDKLRNARPDSNRYNASDNLGFWESLSLLRKIVNAPAEDSIRNGWQIKTSLDSLGKTPETQSQEMSLSRYIQNRLDELNAHKVLKDAVRYTRIYSKGCLVYYIVDSDIPQTETILSEQMPAQINEITAINVIEETKFHLEYITESPLSSYYNKPKVLVEDTLIHPSRFRWLVKDYNRKLKTGKSILDDALEFAKTQDSSHWSIHTMILEMATKIFKSPEVGRNLKSEKLNDFLRRLRMALSSQSVLALNTEEEFAKSNYNLSGLGEVLNWIMDGFAIMAEIPQARLKGAAHGVLASGSYDMQSYFESVSRIQNNYQYKVLCDIISLILRERKTIETFGESVLLNLDWDVVFNPLWELSPLDQAEIEKKRSERDKLDIESGKVTPMEARKLDPRLAVLEQFDTNEI